MKKELLGNYKELPVWTMTIICVAFAILGVAVFHGVGAKIIAVTAGCGILVLLTFGDLKRLGNLQSLLLLSQAAFTMLTIFWALSGKFFLGRYAVTFTATFFFLYTVLRGKGTRGYALRTIDLCAGISTLFAALGVEGASTKLSVKIINGLLGESLVSPGFGSPARLRGFFDNPNIEASFYALGAFLCIALICCEEKKLYRALWTAALAVNIYALVLGVSIFAIVCFVISFAIYLICAKEKRTSAMLSLLNGAVWAITSALITGQLHEHDIRILLINMIVCAVIAAVLEIAIVERVTAAVETHSNIFGIIIGVPVAAFLVFAIVCMGKTYTFKAAEDWVQGYITLSAGEHVITIEAKENVDVGIYGQTRAKSIAGVEDSLLIMHSEEAPTASFSVMENKTVCRIRFYGTPGDTLRSATIDGRLVRIGYWRLPWFIASRIKPLLTNNSFLQRQVYVQDGLKLFRLSPIVGLGDGAFESAVSMVQEYEYETNHSHNQYIETLLEGGVIGFTLFVGALVTMGIALWKSRKKMQEGELAWLYPALCAEFVMSTLQMFWDVSMSVTVFACMIYTLYGLIVSTCAEPLVLKKVTEQDLTTEKKSTVSAKTQSDIGVRIACSALPLLFIVSVGLNIHAQKLIREPVETLDEFMSNLSRAAKIDLYEHNDTKLSYVRAQMENDEEGIYYAQANEYAQQLSKVQSNSIPYILTVYYLNTQQYELAIEEAKLGARYSASDSDMWNNCADALKQMFIDTGAYSPLLEEGNGSLIWGLEEYREMLLERDAKSLKPISLNENSVIFFDKVGELFNCRSDRDALIAVLTGTAGD